MEGSMSAVPVTVANFTSAETDRMFSAFAVGAGGLNRFHHTRLPTPLDQQTVIRMNRDTLYSVAVVDLDGEPRLTIPDAGDRYLSVMVVNQDHCINQVLREPGVYTLRRDDFDIRYAAIAARILVDPVDPTDVTAVNAIQDRFELSASTTSFDIPTTTRPASTPCAPRCWSWPSGPRPRRSASDARKRSTRWSI